MRQLTVTIPDSLVEAMERKVRSGDFSSASDFVRAGIESLLDLDASIDNWLRDEVVAGHLEYIADPSRGVLSNDILDRIRQRRAATTP